MAFVKGQSGNPGGRPKVLAELKDLARQHTTTALEALVSIAGNEKAPESARVSASIALLDRGWGKPMQHIEATGKDGAPLQSESNPADIARRVAFMLRKGADAGEEPQD